MPSVTQPEIRAVGVAGDAGPSAVIVPPGSCPLGKSSKRCNMCKEEPSLFTSERAYSVPWKCGLPHMQKRVSWEARGLCPGGGRTPP